MNGNQSTAHIHIDVDEEKNRDRQALDSIVGHTLKAHSNIKHLINFLEEIILTEKSSTPELQRDKILELISNDGDFVKKQIQQIVFNMEWIDYDSYAPSVAAKYGIEITRVLDSIERLIPKITLIKMKKEKFKNMNGKGFMTKSNLPLL
ncbi:hypothetical protein [Fodinibius sediminis]|uniref:Uncharacterized protein n=1 Tax=Fodinibius sediminis TaxID=1214077 RepID=A0A521CG81_9BACT|nr:hypothetical protein [Fodinibius sediminis]SMO58444.1 hypothetical protein SAMN06265218_10627 [Fodinibius sediminis]